MNATSSHILQDYEVSTTHVMAKQPLVSVLMLAYNHGEYLSQAIDSVLLQRTDFPIELLIGEDCSTDDTREIALHYQHMHPELIRIITADTNVGIQRNWQRLVTASRGEFIAHLDGDDYWLAGKLAPQISFLRKNPNCAAVYTAAATVNESGEHIGQFNDIDDGQFDLADMLRRGNFLNTSSMVFRSRFRNLLLELDELFIDYRVHLRLARHGFLAQLGEKLTVYRINSTGSMTSRSNDLVRKLYWDAIMDVPRDLVSPNDIAHGVTDFLRRVVSRSLRTRRLELLQEWVPKAFGASPYGITRTILLLLASALRATALTIVGRVRSGFGRSYENTLHRR